jgi:tight adherence protein C
MFGICSDAGDNQEELALVMDQTLVRALPVDFLGSFLAVRAGRLVFAPFDTCVVIVALTVALASAFRLWRIGEQEDRLKRLFRALPHNSNPPPSDPVLTGRPPLHQRLGTKIASMKIIGAAKQRSLLACLVAAGFKEHGHLSALITSKLCSAVVFGPIGWLFLDWHRIFPEWPALRLAALAAAFILGWRFPEIVVSRLATRRRLRLENGVPDALDLLVICAEAGLSLDNAIEHVGRALRSSSPEVANEFATTAAEMQVLSVRGQALENLAERTGLVSLRGIIVTLNQSIKFGTSLAESLRVVAAEMRAETLARFEERAARLPVLLTMPLMTFVLPSLMIVIGTPLVLRIMDILGGNSIVSLWMRPR